MNEVDLEPSYAAKRLEQNPDFKRIFIEDLFNQRKSELVKELGYTYNLVNTESKERILLELSHIAYIESYIDSLIENTNQ